MILPCLKQDGYTKLSSVYAAQFSGYSMLEYQYTRGLLILDLSKSLKLQKPKKKHQIHEDYFILIDDERNTAPTKILKHNFISYRFQSHRLSSVKSYHSIKLLTFIHCTRTPPRRGRTDPKPLCHFDPLLPRNVYAAWLFDSCIPL